jgi:two-component system chemotaxis response regulator CheB
MDGLTFLAKLMKHYPLPVVVVSSLTPENSQAALQALALGAVEVISKPGSQYSVPRDPAQLVRAIRASACARPKRHSAGNKQEPVSCPPNLETASRVLAIGASTGGTQAIEALLRALPTTVPGTVIVQHMPEFFTRAFAERLNKICALKVREARDMDSVVSGLALIAPGNKHMLLQKDGARYLVRIKEGPPVHHQRPSVDVLFHSVAGNAGHNAVGVLLTGMGADGAKGLLALKQSGAHTIAQDEESCVVFGMPKEAIKLGAAEQVVPLTLVAQTVLNTFAKM